MNYNNQATVLGIDVGGANLKYAVVAADQDHQKADKSESERFVTLSKSTPFPMWNESHRLANQIAHDLAEIKRDSLIACAITCLLYTSPSPRDRQKSRMPSSA